MGGIGGHEENQLTKTKTLIAKNCQNYLKTFKTLFHNSKQLRKHVTKLETVKIKSKQIKQLVKLKNSAKKGQRRGRKTDQSIQNSKQGIKPLLYTINMIETKKKEKQ